MKVFSLWSGSSWVEVDPMQLPDGVHSIRITNTNTYDKWDAARTKMSGLVSTNSGVDVLLQGEKEIVREQRTSRFPIILSTTRGNG